MALDRTSIPVRFAGGVDTKTAEQLVVPGSFLSLKNCVRRKTGRIEKRNGFSSLSSEIAAEGASGSVSGLSITAGVQLATLKDTLVLLDADNIYSYIEATDQWTNRGDLSSVLVDSDPLVRNSFRQAMPDICTLAGVTVVVYEDSRAANTIRCSVFDDSSLTPLLFDEIISSTGQRPRCAAANSNTILIGYRNTSTSSLGLASIRINSPTVLNTLTTVETGAFTSAPWDFISYEQFALAAFNTTGAETRLVPINSMGAVGTGTNGMPVPTTISFEAVNGISAQYDADTGFFYFGLASATEYTASVVPVSFNSTYDATPVAQNDIANVGIVVREAGDARLFIEIGSPSTVAERKDQRIEYSDVTFAALVTSVTALVAYKRSVGISSKPWLRDDEYFIGVAHESSLQTTYFILNEEGLTVAKALPGLGGGLTQDTAAALAPGPSSVVIDTQGRYSFAGLSKNTLRAAEDGTIVADSVGVQKLSFTYGGEEFDNDVMGENLYFAGGIAMGFDGASATELNFHLYPEDLTTAAATGTLPTGTYYYSATYEWQDAKGEIHRSSPSIVTSASSAASGGITVTVPLLRLTRKTGDRADCKVVLYSGEVDDDQILYRLDDATNSLSADAVTFTDNAPRSATFSSGEVLYTTGGVVPNIAPPASRCITNHKNRIWLGGLEDGLTLAYTREHVYGEGANFSDFLTMRVDPRGGAVTTVASMDDNLVIFKRDQIFVLTGDGPFDTGAQNDYGTPNMVAGDVGCISTKSVVLTPLGLVFKSDKGIYLLDRALGTRYIGDRVERYNSETITSAVVLEDTNEVRFTTESGAALIYNYYFDQWSTFENYQAVAAVRALDSYVHLKSDGTVNVEDTSIYNDNGATYSMEIETSWFQFGDLQGYQRIYYVMGLGDYVSNHHTRVKMAYDYEDAYTETTYFNVDNGLDISYYGDDATYGDSSVYGGSGTGVYQWYLRPRRQKCQAMKLQISDIDTLTDNGGGSFNFVGLTLMTGIKQNGPRTRGGQEMG